MNEIFGNIIIPFSLMERFLLVYNDQGLKFDLYENDIKLSPMGVPIDDWCTIRRTPDHYAICMNDGWADNALGHNTWEHYIKILARAKRGFFIKILESVKPGNPYLEDSIRCGRELIDDIEFMHDHVEEARREAILIDRTTGERVKIFFPIKQEC